IKVVPPSIQAWQKPLFGFLCGCCAIVIFAMYFPAKAYVGYQLALSRIQTGTTGTVKGPVVDYVPYTPGKNHEESFTVGRMCFSYDPNAIDAGFRQARTTGSPIHDGLEVRATYVEDTIVRLEICPGTGPPS